MTTASRTIVGQALGRLGVLAGALALAVALLTGIVAIAGYDAPRALNALWQGAFGSWDAFTSATLVRATPLVLSGLAVALAFRAGVLNIGAEGQLLAGATAAAAVGLMAGDHGGPIVLGLMLVASIAAGALWAGIAAVLRARFGVLDVISTLMLNFVAQDIVAWLVRGPLQEPQHIYPQTSSLSAALQLPRLFPGGRLHAGTLLAVALAGGLAWYLARTAGGFRLRVAGANPFAAASAGQVRVVRVAALAFVASGGIAGLAGGIELTGVTFALYENLSPGYGFTAIAVALLARLDPLAILVTGTIFGALEVGGTAMQRDAGVPSVLVSVVEALLILVLVVGERARTDGWFTKGTTALVERES
jgi:simple sugar transport system permease protein